MVSRYLSIVFASFVLSLFLEPCPIFSAIAEKMGQGWVQSPKTNSKI